MQWMHWIEVMNMMNENEKACGAILNIAHQFVVTFSCLVRPQQPRKAIGGPFFNHLSLYSLFAHKIKTV